MLNLNALLDGRSIILNNQEFVELKVSYVRAYSFYCLPIAIAELVINSTVVYKKRTKRILLVAFSHHPDFVRYLENGLKS